MLLIFSTFCFILTLAGGLLSLQQARTDQSNTWNENPNASAFFAESFRAVLLHHLVPIRHWPQQGDAQDCHHYERDVQREEEGPLALHGRPASHLCHRYGLHLVLAALQNLRIKVHPVWWVSLIVTRLGDLLDFGPLATINLPKSPT